MPMPMPHGASATVAALALALLLLVCAPPLPPIGPPVPHHHHRSSPSGMIGWECPLIRSPPPGRRIPARRPGPSRDLAGKRGAPDTPLPIRSHFVECPCDPPVPPAPAPARDLPASTSGPLPLPPPPPPCSCCCPGWREATRPKSRRQPRSAGAPERGRGGSAAETFLCHSAFLISQIFQPCNPTRRLCLRCGRGPSSKCGPQSTVAPDTPGGVCWRSIPTGDPAVDSKVDWILPPPGPCPLCRRAGERGGGLSVGCRRSGLWGGPGTTPSPRRSSRKAPRCCPGLAPRESLLTPVEPSFKFHFRRHSRRIRQQHCRISRPPPPVRQRHHQIFGGGR